MEYSVQSRLYYRTALLLMILVLIRPIVSKQERKVCAWFESPMTEQKRILSASLTFAAAVTVRTISKRD